MEHFDYIVVGAGIEGTWTAYQLLRDSPTPSVLLVERFQLPHTRGSSHGQSRVIRHSYPDPYHTALMPHAFVEWRQLEIDSSTTLLTQKPLLSLGIKGDETLDKIAKYLKIEQSKGGNDISFKQLSSAELRKEFPQAKFLDDHVGIVEKSAGILYADKCLATLQSQFKALGGKIRDGFLVEKIVPGSKVQVVGQHLGQLSTVTASKVALCPGPWAKTLIEPLLQGIKLPLKAVRVPVFYWKVKVQGKGAMDAILIDYSPGKAWSLPELEYNGMVKLSSNADLKEIDPDDRDKNVEDISPALGEHIRNFYPGMEDSPSIYESCIYTMTPDEAFILDCVPGQPNIAFACGFSGSGYKKGPCVGIMLKELLKQTKTKQFDGKAFSLSRFGK